MYVNIDIELLRSITPEKMIELEFWKLEENDFRKLNAALEKRKELEERKKNGFWHPLGSYGKDVGLPEGIPCQKVYRLATDTFSETCYYIANDSYDAVVVSRKDEDESVQLRRGYWAPEFFSILNGNYLKMQSTIFDIRRSSKYNVSLLTACLFGDAVEEFISEMNQMSKAKREGLIESICAKKMFEPLLFFGQPSERLKDCVNRAGFFNVAYAVINYQSSKFFNT